MMEGPHDPIFFKGLGAIIGTIAGLAYMKPRNIRDAISRVIVSMSVGFPFAFFPVEYFGWPENPERWTAGGVLMAAAAWPIAGALSKWISKKSES